MKNYNLLLSIFMLLVLFCIASCSKYADNQQEVMDKLEGTWNIKQITFTRTNMPDTIIQYVNSSITFLPCEAERKDKGKYCLDNEYEILGATQKFSYQITEKLATDDFTNLNIQLPDASNSNTEVEITGSWSIDNLTGNNLEMSGGLIYNIVPLANTYTITCTR